MEKECFLTSGRTGAMVGGNTCFLNLALTPTYSHLGGQSDDGLLIPIAVIQKVTLHRPFLPPFLHRIVPSSIPIGSNSAASGW